MSRDWKIAVIVDPNCDRGTASTLASNMPLWIVDSPGNAPFISAAWSQKCDCTSFKVVDAEGRIWNLLSNFETIELHHPSMTLIHIVGLDLSEPLRIQLADVGFVPARSSWFEAIAFRRLHIVWTDTPTLHLNAAGWKTADDVYDALFDVLKSPSWHGRNFNALDDSIMTGQINKIEPPFQLVIEKIERATPEAKGFTVKLLQLLAEFQDRGCPISTTLL